MTTKRPLAQTWLTRRADPTAEDPKSAPPGDEVEKIPPGHGRIVRDEDLQTPIEGTQPVSPPMDANGQLVPRFHEINRVSPNPSTHQNPEDAVVVGARPGAHVAPTVEPDPSRDPAGPVHQIQSAQTMPQSGAQYVTPQVGLHNPQHRVVPATHNGEHPTATVVPGDLTSAQAAQVLAQGSAPGAQAGHPVQPGSGATVVGTVSPQRSGPMPTGTILQQNDQVTILLADEETTRREVELSGVVPPAPPDEETTPEGESLGAYLHAKLGRTIAYGDPGWNEEHYELVTGKTWHAPSESELPPPAPEDTEDTEDTEVTSSRQVATTPGGGGGIDGGESESGELQPLLTVLEAGKHAWCACGKSEKGPFCDGSHKGTDSEPVLFELETRGNVVICQCRRSSKAPFCDGTHIEVAKAQAAADVDSEPPGEDTA